VGSGSNTEQKVLMAFRQNLFRKKELFPATNLIEKYERNFRGNVINQRSGNAI
jgi:hypothetical protein